VLLLGAGLIRDAEEVRGHPSQRELLALRRVIHEVSIACLRILSPFGGLVFDP